MHRYKQRVFRLFLFSPVRPAARDLEVQVETHGTQSVAGDQAIGLVFQHGAGQDSVQLLGCIGIRHRPLDGNPQGHDQGLLVLLLVLVSSTQKV